MKREEKAKKVSFFTRLKTNKELLVLSMPGAIWFLLFAYLPLFGILVAFKRYRLSGNFFESLISSEFVGLDNFKFLFSSGDAWIILRTRFYTMLPLSFSVLCFLLSWLYY